MKWLQSTDFRSKSGSVVEGTQIMDTQPNFGVNKLSWRDDEWPESQRNAPKSLKNPQTQFWYIAPIVLSASLELLYLNKQ